MNILNSLSKVYETLINDIMLLVVQTFLSDFASAYRQDYCVNHVLKSLLENWITNLNNNEIASASLMDLSKAFDFLSHDIIWTNWIQFCFSNNFLTFYIHT